MKNLEKILMVIGFISALTSMVFSIILNQPWTWQLSTMLWIIVCYTKEKLINRYQNLVKKMTNE